MAKEQKTTAQKRKILIAVLVTLLILSVGALAVRIVYLNLTADKSATTVVPNNLIGEDTATSDAAPNHAPAVNAPSTPTANAENSATVIELYSGQASDNEKFQVTNMLPGDTETKYFAVKVSHHADVTVYFNAVVTEQTKNLAQTLHIRVTHLENGNVIYSGTFADMQVDGYGETFAATESTETVAYYKIEVSLPTSTGNEYQAAKLMADFNWFVKDTGPLDSPQTGDTSNTLVYFLVMICSLAVLIVLLLFRHKDKEDDNAEKK